MLTKIKKNAKGFTLVEVIVVAVIVAVLALVAVQLYQGYVRESRKNTAENLAASAAGFLQAQVNSGWTASSGNASNGGNLPSVVANAVFYVPANANVYWDASTGLVTANVSSVNTSGTYKFTGS